MKKKELQPIIEEKKADINQAELKQISEQLQRSVVTSSATDDTDTFYKNIVNHLYDKTDIETKTEYLNITENFTGTKLSFLAKFGNMPYLEKFVEIFESSNIRFTDITELKKFIDIIEKNTKK